MRLLAIAVGGAIGATLRYLVSGWVQNVTGPRFPWGTLAVNTLGSFVVGLLMGGLLFHTGGEAWGRHFWVIGVIGGFTTYSAFSYETVAMIEVADWWGVGGNVLLNLVLSLGAVLVGLRLGDAW
jgi:CrcB protein